MNDESAAILDRVVTPALLRHARYTYGNAMRAALAEAGYDDIPKNGLSVIGGMAMELDDLPLGILIRNLRISKQAAGQLVDALVLRGYLERAIDPGDRRKLTVKLTEHGRAAAAAQRAARERVDAELVARAGKEAVDCMRKTLATLIDIGEEAERLGCARAEDAE